MSEQSSSQKKERAAILRVLIRSTFGRARRGVVERTADTDGKHEAAVERVLD
jgi:hypothetical protein